jgi:hypothetical protein
VGEAVARVAPGLVPPETWLTTPSWWAMVDPVTSPQLAIDGVVRATRSPGVSYVLQWAPGVQPSEAAFRTFASGTGQVEGVLGTLDLGPVAAALPGSTTGAPPSDPHQYNFTVRVIATDAAGNRGEDRRAFFAFHDPTWHPGWPRFEDTGGESSLVLFDLDGDGTLEVIEADSSGTLRVTRHDGTPLPGFNGGQSWTLPPAWNYHAAAPGFASGAVRPATGGLHTPAVHDLDGDGRPEIVVTTGDGHVYVLHSDGTVVPGFPVSVDPALSAPALRSQAVHVKRGFYAAPGVGDLDGDGRPEIIASALDGHVYVWSAEGVLRPGFPVFLSSPPAGQTFVGGELISTPTQADLDGDGDLELVIGSSELYPDGLLKASRIYALHHDGTRVAGWPVSISGLLPDLIPFLGPGLAVAAADTNGDGDDEVVATITSGCVCIYDGDGTKIKSLDGFAAVGRNVDPAVAANIYDFPIVGDIDGDGGLDVAKGGSTLNYAVNLLLVGQNLPYSHVVQAWDVATGRYKPAYPVAVEDFQWHTSPALADVGGLPGREILFGTGLYLVHALGAGGAEAPGFPKLAGGWVWGVPAVGDIDGDGDLEVAASTREGWRFVWETGAAATAGTNDEWWTEGHDECHSWRRATDCRPPAAVTGLTARREGDQVRVSFDAGGDDGLIGTASRYAVTVVDRDGGRVVTEVAGDEPRGTPVTVVVAMAKRTKPVAVEVVAIDDAGNRSVPAPIALRGKRGGGLPAL